MLIESMVDRHDVNLDEIAPAIEAEHYYAAECVSLRGEAYTLQIQNCADGHLYSWYPIGGPLLATPLFIAMRWILHLLQPLLVHIEPHVHPVIASFLRAEMTGPAHVIVEAVIASFLVALTAVLLYFIARRDLEPRRAALLAWIFAFATSAWSTASRGLTQHAPSMLMIAAALAILVRCERFTALAAVPAAFSYVVRPTDSLFFAMAALYVLIHRRKHFVAFSLCAMPVFAGFAAFNLSVYHAVWPSYYAQRPPFPVPLGRFATALAGNLISPGRGLFIFSPILLLSLWGMVLAWRTRWTWPFSAYWTVLIFVHWITISLFVDFWWGGHSYGPRFFTDMMPLFALFLIPWMKDRPSLGPAFFVLLAVSVFIHARGSLTLGPHVWNVNPVEIDQHPERLWDWRDPSFLRR